MVNDNATTEYTKDNIGPRQELVAKIDFSSLGTNEERIARRHASKRNLPLTQRNKCEKRFFDATDCFFRTQQTSTTHNNFTSLEEKRRDKTRIRIS